MREDGRRAAGRARRTEVGSLWPHYNKRRHDPKKKAAEVAVANAIRLGTLIPQPCERCGETPAEAHHDDYGKPLAVRWLCRKHHRNVRVAFGDSRRAANEAGKDDILAITQIIRDEMDRQGLTQHELARRAGVTQAAVSGWFNGSFKSVGMIVVACRALNFTLPYVFGELRESAQEAPHVGSRAHVAVGVDGLARVGDRAVDGRPGGGAVGPTSSDGGDWAGGRGGADVHGHAG